jgi:hypothetical protein
VSSVHHSYGLGDVVWAGVGEGSVVVVGSGLGDADVAGDGVGEVPAVGVTVIDPGAWSADPSVVPPSIPTEEPVPVPVPVPAPDGPNAGRPLAVASTAATASVTVKRSPGWIGR